MIRTMAISSLLAMGIWAMLISLWPTIWTEAQTTRQIQQDKEAAEADPFHERLREAGETTKRELLMIAGFLSTILAVAGTAVAIKKQLINPILEAAKKVHGTIDTLNRLDKLWSPDGGSSYADAVFQIREELFVAKAHLHIIQRHLSIPTFELDEFGNLEDANKIFMQILDATEAEVHGSGWLGFIPEKNRSNVWNSIKEALQQKRDFSVDEVQFAKNNSDLTLPFRLRGFRRIGPGDELLGFVVSLEKK